jgi:hypothetical protein
MAIATIVWSTNIIATAKIIAVRTRYLLCRVLISVFPLACPGVGAIVRRGRSCVDLRRLSNLDL